MNDRFQSPSRFASSRGSGATGPGLRLLRAVVVCCSVLVGSALTGCQSNDTQPKAKTEAPGAAPRGSVPPLAPIRGAEERQARRNDGPSVEERAAALAYFEGKASPVASASLPAGASWVGGVNFGALRSSPIFRQLRPWIDWGMAQPEVKTALEVTSLTVDNVDTLVASGQLVPLAGVAVLQGSFDSQKAVDGLLERIRQRSEVSSKQVHETTLFTVEGEDGALAAVDKGVLAAGTPRLLAGVVGVRKAKAPSTAEDTDLTAMQLHIDTTAGLWAAARIPELALADVRRRLDSGSVPLMLGLRELLGATAVAGSLDVAKGVTLRLAARLRSPEDAKVVAGQLKLALRVVGWVAEYGWITALTVSAEGPVVRLSAQIDETLWEEASFWIAVLTQLAWEEPGSTPDF